MRSVYGLDRARYISLCLSEKRRSRRENRQGEVTERVKWLCHGCILTKGMNQFMYYQARDAVHAQAGLKNVPSRPKDNVVGSHVGRNTEAPASW